MDAPTTRLSDATMRVFRSGRGRIAGASCSRPRPRRTSRRLENRSASPKPTTKDSSPVTKQLHVTYPHGEIMGSKRMLPNARQKHHNAPNTRTGCSRSRLPRPLTTRNPADATKRTRTGSGTEGTSPRAMARPSTSVPTRTNAMLMNVNHVSWRPVKNGPCHERPEAEKARGRGSWSTPTAERPELADLSRRIATNPRRPAWIASSRRDLAPYEAHAQFA